MRNADLSEGLDSGSSAASARSKVNIRVTHSESMSVGTTWLAASATGAELG
jgi:hypothetical protein